MADNEEEQMSWAGCAIKNELEKQLHPKCSAQWSEYQACKQRIQNDTTGEAQCRGQYFEYYKCIDLLVSPLTT